jgi:hypothetical protein
MNHLRSEVWTSSQLRISDSLEVCRIRYHFALMRLFSRCSIFYQKVGVRKSSLQHNIIITVLRNRYWITSHTYRGEKEHYFLSQSELELLVDTFQRA